MHALIQQLISRAPVVTDGAWGTELQARGLGTGEFPDAWNLTHPSQVLEVARGYVEAGSRILLTNTFGANRIRLAAHGLANQAEAINRKGVEISRAAGGGRALVFAAIGPTGKLLMTGDVTLTEVSSAFEEQARALLEAGADALVVETMSDLEEAKCALACAVATGLPVVACMVFDSGRNLDCTLMGVTPEQAAAALTAAGADVIGANCGQGIEAFPAICSRLKAASGRPVWIKANAGQPSLVQGRVHYTTTPRQFASGVPDLVDAGADFIGGCCGTNPEFIREIGSVLARIAVSHGEGAGDR